MIKNIISETISIPEVSLFDNRFDLLFQKAQDSFDLGNIDKSHKETVNYIDRTNFRYAKPFFLLSKILQRKGEQNLSRDFQLIGNSIDGFETGELEDKDLLIGVDHLKALNNNLCKIFYVFALKMNGKFEKAIDYIQENFYDIEDENKINYYYMLYSLNRDVKNFEMAFSIYQNIKDDDFLSKKYIVTGYAENHMIKNELNDKGINLILDAFKYEDELLQTNGKTTETNIDGTSFHTLLCFLLSFFLEYKKDYNSLFKVLFYGYKTLPSDNRLEGRIVGLFKDSSIDPMIRKKYIETYKDIKLGKY